MISIVIPTKNGLKFIERAIKSVQAQTEQDFEIIIVNDASTDHTAAILSDLSQKDRRIRVITNKESVGPGMSRNIGVNEAKSELVAFLDDDDEWISGEKLTVQKRFLEENKNVVLVGSAKNNFIKEDGTPYPVRIDTQPVSDAEIRKTMLWRNPFITSSVMLRKDAYLKVGGFAPMFLAEDYDLWIRLGQQGEMANLYNCDINYMVREGSASSTRKQEMNQIVLDLVKKYKNEYPSLYLLALLKAHARIFLFNIKKIF